MIKRNKNITIIYGGKGKTYADKLQTLLQNEKSTYKYGYNANIIMENIICLDILEEILKIVKETDIAIVFLTKDDIVETDNNNIKYRSRQNVILEIGMLLSRIGLTNCVFLADFNINDANYDLPSDLQKICANYFDDSNINTVFENVFAYIQKTLKLTDYSNLIYDNNYIFQYNKMFSDEDRIAIYQKPEEKQFEEILNLWEKEIKSLSYVDQQLVFLLERLPIVNLFKYTEYKETWLKNILTTIKNNLNEDHSKINKLVYNITLNIIQYIKDKDDNLEDLYYELKINTKSLKEYDSINNIVKISACDYLALASMHLFMKDKSNIKYIEDSIYYFKECLDIANEYDDTVNLWTGYLYYNLARAYNLYNSVKDNDPYKDEILYFTNKAIKARKSWLYNKAFTNNLMNNFSYEYFLAKIFKYKIDLKYKENKDELELELNQINNEFDIYFVKNKTSNSLLLEIKEILNNL